MHNIKTVRKKELWYSKILLIVVFKKRKFVACCPIFCEIKPCNLTLPSERFHSSVPGEWLLTEVVILHWMVDLWGSVYLEYVKNWLFYFIGIHLLENFRNLLFFWGLNARSEPTRENNMADAMHFGRLLHAFRTVYRRVARRTHGSTCFHIISAENIFLIYFTDVLECF